MKKKTISFVSVLCATLLSLALVSCSHDTGASNNETYPFQGHEYITEIEGGVVAVDFYTTGNSGMLSQIDPSGNQITFGCTYTVNGNTVTMSFNGQSETFTYYPNEDGFRWGPYWLGRND